MLSRVPSRPDGLLVRFWGVRGSINASGPAFAEFGHHTACVEIRCGDRLFVVDAGSGLGALGGALDEEAPEEIDILLSHLHLDHVIGLPFFRPLHLQRRVRIHAGNLGGETPRAALDRLFSPPLFPIGLQGIDPAVSFHGFKAGETLRFPDGTRVETCMLDHPSGSTGFRFDHGGRSVCYVSDLEHGEDWPAPDLVRFVRGADLVIYDAMFSEAQYPSCRGWGHSTWQAGAALCRAADVGAMAIFHLHPTHDDATLRAVEAEVKAAMPTSFVAREGACLVYAPVV
ncbi:MAG TPA: MBL fold metallo-hydrolase [Salinarimonas sp.]|jgi:phosphoribosyl 1,2-cyclic phosphodiesterase|nr:MBL fold metallo-hydrolase [Salinarimonas sp.]